MDWLSIPSEIEPAFMCIIQVCQSKEYCKYFLCIAQWCEYNAP